MFTSSAGGNKNIGCQFKRTKLSVSQGVRNITQQQNMLLRKRFSEIGNAMEQGDCLVLYNYVRYLSCVESNRVVVFSTTLCRDW